MSILAELARAERIRSNAFIAASDRLPGETVHDLTIKAHLAALALGFNTSADMMDQAVRAEFAKEIADGAI